MPNCATLKDVLYALSYADARLCRWPNPGGKTPAWSLEPNGLKVLPNVAQSARRYGLVLAEGESKFGEQRYRWKTAA